MGIEIMGKYTEIHIEERRVGWAQRWALMAAHPRCIFFRTVAFIWFGYFLWRQEMQFAFLSSAFIYSVGMFSVRGIDLESIRDTAIGKIGLLHLHPANLTIQLIGVVPMFYGLWIHDLEFFLGGLSIVFVGHSFGWEKVDPRFNP